MFDYFEFGVEENYRSVHTHTHTHTQTHIHKFYVIRVLALIDNHIRHQQNEQNYYIYLYIIYN